MITAMPVGSNVTGVRRMSLYGMLPAPLGRKCRTAGKQAGQQEETDKKETSSTSDNILCVHDSSSRFRLCWSFWNGIFFL